jgi:hypothetical protein
MLTLLYWLAEYTPQMEFLNGIFDEVSGHKLESSQTCIFVWVSTLLFPFYKMLFIRVLLFRGLFVLILKTRVGVWFSVKSASRRKEL